MSQNFITEEHRKQEQDNNIGTVNLNNRLYDREKFGIKLFLFLNILYFKA